MWLNLRRDVLIEFAEAQRRERRTWKLLECRNWNVAREVELRPHRRKRRVIKRLELSQVRWEVLYALARGETRYARIMRSLSLRSSIAKQVRRGLAASGLIELERPDRRLYLARLTTKGRTLLGLGRTQRP